MFLKKIGAGLSGAIALGGAFLWSTAASALPVDWQTGFQPAASPVMDWIEDFHRELLVIIVAVSLFVLALLGWIVIRYNQRRNPVPSKTAHNTLLEVLWTGIPVLIRGGGKVSDEEIFRRTEALLKQGAAGLVYGRNIIQHDNPAGMTRALMAMLHDGADAQQAMAVLRSS